MAGVELATAYVSLVVEGSKVAPGVKSALGAADGEAARSGDRAGRTFTSKFGSALKIGATLGAAFAVTKGIQFLGDAIEEAREASVVTARTANVIESMGDVAGVSAKQVADLAGAISNKVGIDDEAIQSGENLLLTFGKIRDEAGAGNDIFTQTTGLMVDMSVAMDQDMKSSAIQLGKALNDPIKGVTALSRVGVSFTEDQIEQIKALTETNDVLGAQKIILGEVKKQFGGAAKAMATPADRARVAWGNLKEQLGTELLPMVNRVSEWAADEGIPAIADFFREFKKGKGAGGEVREVVEDIAGHVQTAAGHAKDFVGWFNGMPSWAKKVMAGGAAAAFVLPKIPGASALGGGIGSAVGKAVGVQKVFETNPAALGGTGGLGGVGGTGGKPGGPATAGGKVGIWSGLGILAGSAAGLQYDPKDLGWEELESDLLKVNEAFVQIAMSRTGIDNLTGATAALDQIIAGMTLEKPRQGFSALYNLSKATGISMGDLRDVLPATSKAIEESGVKARGSARETGAWKDIIIGAGKAVDHVDGKKPSVGWLFPGLVPGIGDTGRLGGETDRVGGKKPNVPWFFPGLTAGLFNVQGLNRGIDSLPPSKTITITINRVLNYMQTGAGLFPNMGEPKAAGGPISAGRMHLVGERGPEMFVPHTPGRIIPNHRLAAVAGGDGLSDRDVERIAAAVYRGSRDGVADRQTSAHADRRVGRP